MVTVLFVCLGNICRSPMAEAIFRQKVQQAGLESTIRFQQLLATGKLAVSHIREPENFGATRNFLSRNAGDTNPAK